MSHFDITLQALLLVDDHTCGAGFQEGHGERQANLLMRSGRFDKSSSQLTILEVYGSGVKLVRGAP